MWLMEHEKIKKKLKINVKLSQMLKQLLEKRKRAMGKI